MRHTNQSWNKVGYLLCSAAALALTGCVTHVHHGPARVVHVPAPAPPVPPPPPAVVVIQHEHDFYEPLTPYGEWVMVASYGRCWRPARVMAGWRPYADGHWERTDAGWYWVSDEPWAWATYHYGRWDWTPEYGWVWVPQTQWAPAWVAWREGAGYIGWAPLPPSARIGIHGVIEISDIVIAPRFVFVEERRVLERVRPTTVIVNNTTVINKTVNITKIKVVNHTVINEGPRPDRVERASGRRVQAVAVRDLRDKHETEVVSRRDARRAADKKAEPESPAAAEPKKAVMPHVDPAPAAAEPVKETPIVVVKPQPGDGHDGPRHDHPAHPERRDPPRAEPKHEVTPAVANDARPGRRPEVMPRESRPVEKPAHVAKEIPGAPDKKKEPAPNVAEPKKAVMPHIPPARPDKKPEVKPAPVYNIKPGSARPVLARELEPADKPAEPVKEPSVPPQKPDRKSGGPGPTAPPPASKPTVPVVPTPPAVQEVAPSKKNSDAREKAPGKPEEKKNRGGRQDSTNNAATTPRGR